MKTFINFFLIISVSIFSMTSNAGTDSSFPDEEVETLTSEESLTHEEKMKNAQDKMRDAKNRYRRAERQYEHWQNADEVGDYVDVIGNIKIFN